MGYADVDLALDIFSPNFLDVLNGVEAIRRAMDGFQGVWGSVGIYSVILESGDTDSVEKDQSGAGTWWYSRSLDYRISCQEPIYIVA